MKKNKLFTLFSLTLLSMGTPLTSIAQVVAVSQDTPAITTTVNGETEKKQEAETNPVPTDEDKTGKGKVEAEPVTPDQEKTDQKKSDKKETETKATDNPKNEVLAPSVKNVKTGYWGSASWSFDTNTGTFTINSGALNDRNGAPWDWVRNESQVKKIVFTGPIKAPKGTYGWSLFSGFENLTEIVGLTNLDTSETTSFEMMFNNCRSLTTLDLSSFNTEKVTTMSEMFYGCSSLTTVDLSSFNTEKVTSLTNMFNTCISLTTVDLSSFNTKHEPYMNYMFYKVPLSSLTLGDNFRFKNFNLDLKPPRSLFSASDLMREGKYVTDKWMKKDNQSAAYTAEKFAVNYGKGDLTAGTYVAETPLLLWGNAPYAFDRDTGVLTIKSGTLGQVDSAPWKRDDDKKIDADKIKKISFAGETKAPKNADYLFKDLSNLAAFENLTYLDTSQTTSMVDTFLNCTSLTTLDLSKFNTKNVTDMRGTFRGCTSIKSLDLSNLNTLNVTAMNKLFENVPLVSLTLGDNFKFIPVDISLSKPRSLLSTSELQREGKYLTGKWIKKDNQSAAYDTQKFMENYGKDDLTAGTYVAEIKSDHLWGDASWAFDHDTGILTISPGTLDKPENAPWKLADERKIDADKIKKIKFTGATKAPEDSTYLFRKLTKLTEFENLTYLDTSEVTNMTGMFYDCYDLEKLDLSNFNTSNVTSMERMFFYGTNLESLDLSKFDTKNVTDMTGLFFNCDKLKTLDLSGFNTIKKPTMTDMFDKTVISSLTLGNDFRFIGDDSKLPAPAALNAGDKLTGKWIKTNRGTYPQSPGGFMKKYGTNDLTAGTYVAEIEAPLLWGDAPYTFDENTGTLTIESGRLVKSDQSPWKRDDEKKIDDTKIKKIRLTGPVLAPEDSTELFRKLTRLTEIENLTYLDTSEVTNMDKMFYDCYDLEKLDLSNFNTSNVTSIAYMFFYCVSLESLDLSKFDTKKVTNMSGLFQACRKLKTLDLSGFNTLNKPKMTEMFNDKILSSLTLGNDFRFATDADLPVPVALNAGDPLTGKWIKKNRGSYPQSPGGFMKYYGQDELTAGTYIAEIKSDRLWGDAPWTFDENTGTLTIESGRLGEKDDSPWIRRDEKRIPPSKLKKIILTGPTKAPVNCLLLFSTYAVTEIIGLDKLDTSNVTSMYAMFASPRLTSLDLSNFDTSKVEDMTLMFSQTPLTSIKLGDKFKFKTTKGATALSLSYTSDPRSQGKYMTGNFIKKDKQSAAYSPDNFMANYGKGDLRAGTYVAETKPLLWGDAPYAFDSSTGILTINSGTLDKRENAPWKRSGKSRINPGDIRQIIFTGKTKAPKSCLDLFANIPSLNKIDGLPNLDTSEVDNMAGMFRDSVQLRSVDVSKLDTSNTTDMNSMFRNLGYLQSLDLSNFDTTKVTNMQAMFRTSYTLHNLDLSSFNTANVQRMDYMFYACYTLTSLDLSNFDTAKVTTMQNMFGGSYSLKSLNLSNFDSSALASYEFPLAGMFGGTDSLSSLTLGDKFSMVTTENSSASLPAPIALNSWEKATGKWIREDGNSKAYSPNDFMANYGKGDLTAGTYIAEVNPNKWGDALWTFDATTGTLTVNSGTLEAGATTSPWKRTDGQKIDASRIRKIVFTGKTQAPENSDSLFSGLSNLTEIVNLTNLDTSQVTNMSHMFIGCKSLKTLDLSQFNTSNVTLTEWMFQDCASLTELNLKSFDTSKLTKMWMMFSGCASLTSLDLSNFDTKSVVTMGKLFYGCSSLISVNLSSFDTSQVTHMGAIFQDCTSLTSIDLSSFDTGNVTTMQKLFKNTPLASLTLGVKFKSMGDDADLPLPTALNEGDQLTGNWVRKDGQSKAYSPKNFMANYGKEDLQAGTYVGELISSGAILETNISFSTDSGKTVAKTAVIGDQLQAKLTVKHSEKSPTDATADDVKLSTISLLTDAWALSPTVTVRTFDQTGKQTASNEQTIKNNELNLPTLPFGSYVEITLTGTAWEKAYTIPGGNYNYTLSYKNQSGDKKVKKSGNFIINSGAFGFKSVPNISFKDNILPINSNQIIDRKDADYAISVTDYRGTRLPDGQTAKPDRVDWEITATASPFKDAAGKEIKLSTMAISFTKAIGQTTELGADATLITSHDVTGETAKQNNLTKLSWAKELGFKVVVHSRTDLDTTKYTADVAFDLRTAP